MSTVYTTLYSMIAKRSTASCISRGIRECKRAQPSGIGSSWSQQSTIVLLRSIELLEGRDDSIKSFPNFVRMRD